MTDATGMDWGTVPAWVGSVLSGASVLLALLILVRDRRSRQRAQAEQIGLYILPTAGPTNIYVTVFLHNASSQTITVPVVQGLPLHGLQGKFDVVSGVLPFEGRANKFVPGKVDFIFRLLAGEDIQYDISLKADREYYIFFLEFMDARGQKWRLDADRDNRLTKLPLSRFGALSLKRWQQSYKPDRVAEYLEEHP